MRPRQGANTSPTKGSAAQPPQQLQSAVNDQPSKKIVTKITPPKPEYFSLKGLPPRPGFCDKGVACKLITNHVEVRAPSDPVFYTYDVQILGNAAVKSDKTLGRRAVRRLFEILLTQAPDLPKATNYSTMLVTLGQIPGNALTQEVEYKERDEPGHRNPPLKYSVVLKPVACLQMSQFMAYLRPGGGPLGQAADTGLRGSFLTALNLIIGQRSNNAGSDYVAGANRFFRIPMPINGVTTSADLSGGLTAKAGLFRSMKSTTGKLLLNLNVTNGAFYTAGPLTRLANDYFAANHHATYEDLSRFLKGLRVHTEYYSKKKKKHFKIVRTICEVSKGRGGNDPTPDNVWFVKSMAENSVETTVERFFSDGELELSYSGILLTA